MRNEAKPPHNASSFQLLPEKLPGYASDFSSKQTGESGEARVARLREK
jgi:hypothetical protein